jgi:hypothetical protein
MREFNTRIQFATHDVKIPLSILIVGSQGRRGKLVILWDEPLRINIKTKILLLNFYHHATNGTDVK